MRRYLETLFRHPEVFLIPFLVTPLLALMVLLYVGKQYEVEALIWAQPSPVLDPLAPSRSVANEREAQAIEEWLETEAFRREVMDQVGLTEAVRQGNWPVPSQLAARLHDTGLTSVPALGSVLKVAGLAAPATTDEAMAQGLNMIRERITVTTEGQNLLRVTYIGEEPVLGRLAVEAVIKLYKDQVMEIRTLEAQTGINFYSQQLQLQEQRLQEASSNFQQFLETHPAPLPGQVRPASEDAQMENLRRSYLLEQTLYESTLRKLDQVRVDSEAAISTRELSFQVVDPPREPGAAGFSKGNLGVTLILGLALGSLLGLVPIVLMTWMDGTVRSVEDIQQSLDPPFVVQAPIIPSKAGQSAVIRGALARGTFSAYSTNGREKVS